MPLVLCREPEICRSSSCCVRRQVYLVAVFDLLSTQSASDISEIRAKPGPGHYMNVRESVDLANPLGDCLTEKNVRSACLCVEDSSRSMVRSYPLLKFLDSGVHP